MGAIKQFLEQFLNTFYRSKANLLEKNKLLKIKNMKF